MEREKLREDEEIDALSLSLCCFEDRIASMTEDEIEEIGRASCRERVSPYV